MRRAGAAVVVAAATSVKGVAAGRSVPVEVAAAASPPAGAPLAIVCGTIHDSSASGLSLMSWLWVRELTVYEAMLKPVPCESSLVLELSETLKKPP